MRDAYRLGRRIGRVCKHDLTRRVFGGLFAADADAAKPGALSGRSGAKKALDRIKPARAGTGAGYAGSRRGRRAEGAFASGESGLNRKSINLESERRSTSKIALYQA